MHKKLQRIIGTALLSVNFMQTTTAALPLSNTEEQTNHLQNFSPLTEMQSLVFTSNYFGIAGPLNAGINYSNLTKAYFDSLFFKQLAEKLSLNVQEEYGDKKYHVNGTTGFLLGAQRFFKMSVE